MPRYGFRVYSLKHRYGRTRADQEWATPTWTASKWFHDCANLLKDQLLEGSIGLHEAEELAALPTVTATLARTRYIRVTAVSRTDRRISMKLRHGMGSDFAYAMSPKGDEPLGDSAPGREYRAELLIPPKDGAALLAVESIASACPGSAVIQWLGAASLIRRPSTGEVWHRLVGGQVSDTEYLDELLERADDARMTLRHRGTDGVGNKSTSTYTLQAPIRTTNQRGRAKKWAREKARAIGGMLEIVGISDSGDLDFNDGYIMLDDGDARTRIGLSGVRDTFTYPISETEPNAITWAATVKERFAKVDPKLGWI